MIKEGDLIFLYKDDRRNYLLKARKDRLHTDKGFIDLGDLIGKDYGQRIETNMGDRFYALRPYLHEMTMKVRRQTQIIYPKDIGIILTKGNIFPGAKVMESGIGSGALTTAMANFVRPYGKVHSFEQNEDFLKNAKKNLEKYNLAEYVEFNHCEITDEYPEKDADFIMIDIANQWDLVVAAYNALKPGARLGAICPNFEQLAKTVAKLEETGFTNIEALETSVRKILVRKGRTRPEPHMASHTGFLVFANKVCEVVIPEESPRGKRKAKVIEETQDQAPHETLD